jgi:excisionase family DNA binding protein
MSTRPAQRLQQALDDLHQALEGFESTLLKFEEALEGGEQERFRVHEGPNLLSIPEVCQELGMGKSWVYRELKSGGLASVKLGRSIKVKRQDLEEYIESQRYRPPLEEE